MKRISRNNQSKEVKKNKKLKLLKYNFFLERILLSSPIFKFNDYKKRQERNFCITTHAIYNLDGTSKNRL